MKTRILLLISIFYLLPANIKSQQYSQNGDKDFFQHEAARYKSLMARSASDINSTGLIDAKYYRLDLNITTTPAYLKGKMLMRAVCLQNGLISITLDLMSALTIDSVYTGGIKTTAIQHPSTFDVNLDRAYNAGELITVEVFYQGVPGSSGFGSFAFSSHSGTPWVWTLSEPYGAKDWWPCNDHPMDKADSADIYVKCDSTFKVGSNGKLLSVMNNGDGTSTHHWKTNYPISTYLISIALTNYSAFSNWFKYSPTDSMEVLNYVLPEHLSSALVGLPKAVDGLTIYSSLFGLYPFISEKYGNAEFGWGGGMEHQTMTYLGGFSEDLVMHELAHQWFGDMITCRMWPHLWLNEGFATYCEILYQERKYGTAAYWSRINGDMVSAKNAVGSVYLTDTSNVGTMFSWSLVYAKGAIVLHMLRHVMGDTAYFHAMYSYANDPRFKYGTATTEDFKSVCETESGKNLSYFFNEWIYGEKYPRYQYGWASQPSTGGYKISFAVTQTTQTSNPLFFTMPIDIKLIASGWDTTVVLFNDQQTQSFEFEVSHQPTSLQFDPAGWILKTKDSLKAITLSSTSKNIGDVYVHFSKQDSITVYNTGLTTLDITSVYSDSSDYVITPSSATIPVASNQKFYITFTPFNSGVRPSRIYFVHNAPNSPEQLFVTGNGQIAVAHLNARWNMVSIPFAVDDPRAGIIFQDSSLLKVPAFWCWYYPNYYWCDTLIPGTGYWVKSALSRDVAVIGYPPSVDTILVRSGWNLIGGPLTPISTGSIQTDPPNIVRSLIFGYNNAYFIADTLKPFKGYWVKVSQDGSIIFSSQPSVAKKSDDDDLLNHLNSILLTDSKGTSQKLYFGSTDLNLDLNKFELPPSSPDGSFDVRFSSGGFVEMFRSENPAEYPIQINAASYPLTLEWEVKQNYVPLSLRIGDQELHLNGKGSFSIQSITHKISIEVNGSKHIPKEFALEQNYPNPFNPTTNFRFSIASIQFTIFKIYDVLGSEVATLVNEVKQPGEYTISWNTRDVPSGVYYYRLTSGTFTDVKKMMVIK